jgi:phosphatidylserine/phosphatidylglycerophosphate/cardiolipin synthase-like enzyme
VRLIIEPDDGIEPLLEGIKSAKKSIEIVIFRFDRGEIEDALKEAARRGVFVHALIASTNRGGEQRLRKLETRLLAQGITVARTANDLLRYHYKLIIIDRKILYLLGFNFTFLDTAHSRSFGIVTTDDGIVNEAVRLFKSDTKRQSYKSQIDKFIVSPVNARKELASFIKDAKKELLIYDGKLTDPQMLSLLRARAKAGVEIKVIGRIAKRSAGITSQKLSRMRQHIRAIVRDGKDVFVGSQSLRKAELDNRREVGIILHDSKIAKQIMEVFAHDWHSEYDAKDVKQAVKEVVKEVVTDFASNNGVDIKETELVKKVVKQAVKEAVEQVVQETEPVAS